MEASPSLQNNHLNTTTTATTTARATATATAKKRKRKPITTTTTRHHDSRLDATLTPLLPSLTSALSATLTFLTTHELTLLPPHSLSLEASLTSASLSLSKIQSFLHATPLAHIPTPLPPPPCWFERLLGVPNDPNDPTWLLTFRMSKPTFDHLTAILSHSLSSLLPSFDPRFALGAALYRLAHNGSFSAVGRRFGMSVKDCCRVFYGVCKVVCEKMGGEVSVREVAATSSFEMLPNCCGVLGVERFCLDGGGGVLGKNGFLMVQGLVDANGRFLDVSAGWPGSNFGPVLALRQSGLFSSVEESKELLNGMPFELSDGSLLPQYVLGDSCYPLLPWLVTPFSRRDEGGEGEGLSAEAREFNEVHRKAMRVVRVAFARVRGNWQLLDRRWKEKMAEFLPFVIMTGCLLNNFLLKQGEVLPEGETLPGCVDEQAWPVYDGEENAGAERTRELLVSHLSRVR